MYICLIKQQTNLFLNSDLPPNFLHFPSAWETFLNTVIYTANSATKNMTYLNSVQVHWLFNYIIVVGLLWKCRINRMKKQIGKTLHKKQHYALNGSADITYKVMKETQSTNPNQRPGLILSSYKTGLCTLHRRGVAPHIAALQHQYYLHRCTV